MKLPALFVLSCTITILVCIVFFGKPKSDPIIGWGQTKSSVVPMPLVLDTNPKTASFSSPPPVEKRGPAYRRYLSASVRVGVKKSNGSGTIIYYDEKGWAYVASCGHLWNETQSASQLERRPVYATVTVWYHNSKKLASPKTYKAEVIFWSNERGYDSSLLRFKPDWRPNYFPIAPEDYNVKAESKQHSLGCDDALEVAHYDVEIIGMRGVDLTTMYNSPRPGRSGGGLLSSDGYYIGTCWGTSAIDGTGLGYFTPLPNIRKVYTNNGYAWLLKIQGGFIPRQIPILDQQNLDQKYPLEYIPLPGPYYIPVN